MSTATLAPSAEAALASGKGHRDENFPVASVLLARRHRAPVMAFYRFARAADDIADNRDAAPADKLALLAGMRATLAGTADRSAPAAALRATCAAHGLDPVHGLDLLTAFERDCTVSRHADWASLIDYCRVSAMPVGRYVLDVHGEDRAVWPLSDALCAALQIVNHLQDCGADYRTLDRVYLPLDMLAGAGAEVADLGGAAATPALRGVIAACADRTLGLLAEARPFARALRSRRLAAEVAIIHALAVSLARRLLVRDPLADRVHHRAPETLAIAGAALLGRVLGR